MQSRVGADSDEDFWGGGGSSSGEPELSREWNARQQQFYNVRSLDPRAVPAS